MKNVLTSILIFIVLLGSTTVHAAEKNEDETPPWMENVKFKGRSTYLVPKGAKRELIGAQVVVEPPNEYVARRIYEIELFLAERFKKIEDSQNLLKKDLDELKESLKNVEKKIEENMLEASD